MKLPNTARLLSALLAASLVFPYNAALGVQAQENEPAAVSICQESENGHDWTIVDFHWSEETMEGTVDAVCANCGQAQSFDTVVTTEEKDDLVIIHYDIDQDGLKFHFQRTVKKLPFEDVNPVYWYMKWITEAYESGLMTGLDETHFGPAVNMSRAMVATVLYRMEGEPAVAGPSGFQDVKEGLWYSAPIAWALENGITTGYLGELEGTFGVDDDITREQMCTMIYRYLTYKGVDTTIRADLSAFLDGDEVSGFAKEAMEYCVAAKIINGAENGTKLLPKDFAIRAHCAKISVNTANLLK